MIAMREREQDKGKSGLDVGKQLEGQEKVDLLGNESNLLLFRFVKLFISLGQRIFFSEAIFDSEFIW